ncbi:MAG: EAL domain-containing protein, partial [Lachnospiraceae bacterium]|nr:EAL domain-containing protein [Lachnospiraceae bacterium]
GHFAILCGDVDREETETSRKKVFARFQESWSKDNLSLTFPVQFGVVRLPDDVRTVENIQMLIDEPFDGKESANLDAAETIADYERRVLVEQLIDKALKKKNFVVWYSVLVEGVETLEQKMLLEKLECDYFQGYYFSKPVEKQVFRDYVRVVNA